MKRRAVVQASVGVALAAVGAAGVRAQSRPFRIGWVLPMTGAFASTGRQQEAGARLYQALHGDTVEGRKVELLLRDDAGVADTGRRMVSELVVNEKVDVVAGCGLTPIALAAAPIATQSKTPLVVTAAATSSITEASPFVVRTSYSLPQSSIAMAQWAIRNKMRRFVSLVPDYGPGLDAEKYFNGYVRENGGTVLGEIRVPMRNPDYAPFLQRVRDIKPEALFVFLPSGPGAIFMRQFVERGLANAGITIIGDGTLTDDDVIGDIGDAGLGVITAQHYSAAHPSALNRRFVAAFETANKGMRPNFMAVGAWDGMRVIHEALRATGGNGDGPALLAAMKGQTFESPRGMMTIDPETRDVIHDIYMRKVEKVNGKLYNVEFDAIKQMKDPAKGRPA
ncbi:ABC transporter substrate-binding protein [Aquabacterium sp. J223]|uniref:ABC transporter substrate-binding protein n=1 Tax=Aquabacterium sp. J223 TaxID=2898431 RepID=UPI0021AE19EB|nr:ABC transporter substrate-binding protein [Aquabacterium sp. J223]UUX95228.1 ABC transporter substrate-binding protein [Aquabacterium sp. J223]